ncbi:MAG: integrase [Lentimicrobium sp.]|uniref:integrase n=1 Tax=Lentimicrobium sp. TaxID=2034841 RepID=UPI0025D712E2|nr:integrase [Lentimicrobium sp.]MCO5257719.1 integrase [Lentimicrobium sp.]
MDEYEKRKVAITRYYSGEKISSIVYSLGRTRQWFYNWLKRFELRIDDNCWYIDESRAPKRKPLKISNDAERQILDIRSWLDAQHYAQTGAIAIQYEFRNRKLIPPPIWTINRVIARNGLNKVPPKAKQSHDYPELFMSTHQMDLVGPRYIKGDGRFYSFNIIDVESHTCFTKPIRTKSSNEIVRAIAEFWHEFGLPDALQMDNELAFRGSNRYPRSFGSVVRFALSQGVAPVFIPIKEPWRNGIIEKFNDTYTKRFIKAKTFVNFEDLLNESKDFNEFHNSHHRYSSQCQKTPNEASNQGNFNIHYNGNVHEFNKIPLETGVIYFIRFIRSDLKLRLITESFDVDELLKYSYVVAEVNIDTQSLVVRQSNDIKHIFPYLTPVDW